MRQSIFNTVARHGIGRKILATVVIVLFGFSIGYAETELVKKLDHVQPSQLQTVTGSSNSVTVDSDKTQRLTAQGRDRNDKYMKAAVAWRMDDTIATVGGKGLLTAKGANSAGVTTPNESTSGKINVDVNIPQGWSSKTNYRFADTDVRRRIVASATAAISKPSGQSTTNGAWQTDVSGGDGERFRKAIWYWLNRDSIGKALQIYEDWSKSNDPGKPSRKEIISKNRWCFCFDARQTL